MTSRFAPPEYSLRDDYVLWLLVVCLLAWMLISPADIHRYPQLVDWPTIRLLLGLLILTNGIESSGWLENLSSRIATHIRGERMMALFLTGFSVLLATVLTNDVALFVVVPLTVSLGRIMALPLRRLVAFEALAVNCGSLLTPIGNPQNIFIWQISGVHFLTFVWKMFPLFVLCMLVLLLFLYLAFRSLPLEMNASVPEPVVDRRLLWISALLYLPFVILGDLHYSVLGLMLVAAVFIVTAPRVVLRIDWPLLIIFVLMFVDLRLLAETHRVARWLLSMHLNEPAGLFMAGALTSQMISNVPAAILLAGYTHQWSVLAWAVDIGGFGLVVGSLANLIALRIGRQRGGMLELHRWSIPFFFVAGLLAYLWLYML